MELRTLLILVIIVMIAVIGIFLMQDNEKRRIRETCWKYAGFDTARWISLGEPPTPMELRQGVRKELKLLEHQAERIAAQMGTAGLDVPAFLVDAGSTFRWFLETVLRRDNDYIPRKRALKLISDAENHRTYELYGKLVHDEFFDRICQWCDDAKQWVEVVDKFCPQVASEIDFIERHSKASE